jgi:hypothetical protein
MQTTDCTGCMWHNPDGTRKDGEFTRAHLDTWDTAPSETDHRTDTERHP